MMIERLRRISYFFAYVMVTIPLWHYIRDGRILALMVAVVTFAYVMVVLSSIQVAQPILSSEKSKATLPRWLPDKPKYHKWWLLVRRTLKWHLLLVPPKMGLALGFVELLHAGFMNFGHIWVIGRSFDYTSHNCIVGCTIPEIYSQLETVYITFSIFLVFACIDCGFIAALYVLLFKVTTKVRLAFLIIGMRCIFSLCIFGVVTLTSAFSYSSYVNPCVYCDVNERQQALNRQQQDRRIYETIVPALLIPSDHAILLGANIMRPVGEESLFALSREYATEEQRYIIKGYDNRPFVARQIVAGLLGLMLYAGATWVILWFVEDEVQA